MGGRASFCFVFLGFVSRLHAGIFLSIFLYFILVFIPSCLFFVDLLVFVCSDLLTSVLVEPSPGRAGGRVLSIVFFLFVSHLFWRDKLTETTRHRDNSVLTFQMANRET